MGEHHSWLLKDIVARWGGWDRDRKDPEAYPTELEGWYPGPEDRRLRIRPVRPEDGPLLRSGLAHLSPETTYRRFHGHLDKLTDDEVRYLTHVDYLHHLALMAIDEGAERAVGVARYYRREGSELAEAAIVVADEWQGKGLGGFLLKGLRDAAEARGVEGFEAWVQDDNAVVLGMLQRRGFTIHTERDGDSLHVWFRFEDLFA